VSNISSEKTYIQLLLKIAEALGIDVKRIVCFKQRQCNISDGSGRS
jgi:pyrroloquinoline quinone (PQQ) biosynthesis protein C